MPSPLRSRSLVVLLAAIVSSGGLVQAAEGERSLRRSVVLDAVAEAEDLRVSDDEVRAEIERAAQTASDPARTARQAFARPETRARIEGILRTRRAIDRLVELAGGATEESGASLTAVSEPTGEVNV